MANDGGNLRKGDARYIGLYRIREIHRNGMIMVDNKVYSERVNIRQLKPSGETRMS